ncbi:MAG: glycosyltransferase [bacterium]
MDGILMQKTEFPFEILLGEDASTDGTREICIEYADKYPDKIRLFLHNRENVIYINGNPTGRFNLLYNLSSARGKYIAICEGDDYWTDPYKLQKQVDFLEENSEYGMISTDITLIDEEGKALEDNKTVLKQRTNRKSEVTFFELLPFNYINTLTTCIRADLLKELAKRVMDENLWFVYDYWFWLQISLKAKIKISDEKTAAYRIHSGGVSRQKEHRLKMRANSVYHAIKDFWSLQYNISGYKNYEPISKMIKSLLMNKYLTSSKKWDLLKILSKMYFIKRISTLKK